MTPTAPPPRSPSRAAPPASGSPVSELSRRIGRLRQWSEAAQSLGTAVPTLPSWAEETARDGREPERWLEVVRGVERLAQRKVVAALEEWERQTRIRLGRLEAYAVDGRLERDQIDDLIRSARAGDLGPALSAFHQVDRVVALKERHIDQTREELERIVGLLRDMAALGLEPPDDPDETAEDLERELRGGRLAPLKQQLRALRAHTLERLQREFPRQVERLGDVLVSERRAGVSVELEAAELARAAREFHRGEVEQALHRLRTLEQLHTFSGPRRPAPALRSDGGPTEASRRA